jgi:hypothetical protein
MPKQPHMVFPDKHPLRNVFSILLTGFFIYLLFPRFFYQPVKEGLVASYDLATHLAIRQHLVFGKDIISVFGPLGILNSRFPVGVNRWMYLLCDCYFLLSILLVLLELFKTRLEAGPHRETSAKAWLLTSLFLFIAFAFAIYSSSVQWYFLLFLFFLFSFIRQPRSRMFFFQTALLSLLCFFYQPSFGIPAIVFFWLGSGYLLIAKKIGIVPVILTFIGYSALLLLSSRLLTVDLPGYIRGTFHLMASTFLPENALYTLLLPSAFFVVLLISLLPLALLAGAIYKKRLSQYRDEIFIFTILLLSVFLLFRSGFVRFDPDHPFAFLCISGLLAGLMYFFCPPTAQRAAAMVTWAVLIRSGVSFCMIPGNDPPALSPFRFLSLRIKQTSAYFRQYSSYPKESEGTKGRSHSTDILPFEISGIYFSGLQYKPRPLVQSYSVSDPYLDHLNYERYLGPDAPDYILLTPECARFTPFGSDYRYPFFEESATKLALFERYATAGEINGDLLLQKKDGRRLQLDGEEKRTAQTGEDLLISDRSDLQVSKIFIHRPGINWFEGVFSEQPLFKITLTLEDGGNLSYKVIPSMLEQGVILNKYVGSLRDLRVLMQSGGHLSRGIKKIRIDEVSAEGNTMERLPVKDNPATGELKIITTFYRFSPKPESERIADSVNLTTSAGPFDLLQPLAAEPFFYKKDIFPCWIDSLQDSVGLIRIRGWAYRNNNQDENILVKAVLRSGTMLYELSSRKEERRDVASFYKKKEPVHGFVASVARAQLLPGKYQVGVLIADTLRNEKWIRYTDRVVTVP